MKISFIVLFLLCTFSLAAQKGYEYNGSVSSKILDDSVTTDSTHTQAVLSKECGKIVIADDIIKHFPYNTFTKNYYYVDSKELESGCECYFYRVHTYSRDNFVIRVNEKEAIISIGGYVKNDFVITTYFLNE